MSLTTIEALAVRKAELYLDYHDKGQNEIKTLRAALSALTQGGVKGEAVYGPYAWLNGHRELSEANWVLERNPIQNNDEYFSIPLYASIDPINEASKDFVHPETPELLETLQIMVAYFEGSAGDPELFPEENRILSDARRVVTNHRRAAERALWNNEIAKRNSEEIPNNSDDSLSDCFRHHIVTTIGWAAFAARPSREMQMYEDGFKAGYRRCKEDNEPELGDAELSYTSPEPADLYKIANDAWIKSYTGGSIGPLKQSSHGFKAAIDAVRSALSRRVDGTDVPLGKKFRQAADAISRLTAERDGFEARLISCDENLTHTLKSYTEMTLERDRADRANKLLSERVAVLETALEPFAKAAHLLDGYFAGALFPDDEVAFKSGNGFTWTENGVSHCITWADFRRALAAREAK